MQHWPSSGCCLADEAAHVQLRFIFSIFASSGMAAAFSLEEGRLSRFIACVASNHHANPYHNLAHTCFVLQATHLVVHATKASGALPQTAHLALLLAALCHDLDHDGAPPQLQPVNRSCSLSEAACSLVY